MTLPDERYRAVMQAKRLLEELCDPKMTPRISAGIRDRARGALRHYPSDWDMQNAANLAPIVFQKEMEPLYRMVKQYEQEKKDV
jgi:DNA-binding protein Fis